MTLKAQLRLDDYTDPFATFVLPRYYEGRPVYEYLQVVALKLAAENGDITSDDLRNFVPPGKNRKVLGAVLGALRRKGYLEPVSPTKTGVPSSHGRVIWIYRITEAGLRYLEELKAELEGWE